MGMMSSIGKGTKWVLKPFFDFRIWSSAAEIKRSAKLIHDEAVDFGKPKEATHEESFTEAMARMQLTETDIKQRQQSFLWIALIFLGLGMLGLAYTIFMLWQGHILGGLLALVVSLLVFAYAFRYHFWFFQIKHRKLGCTIQEWLDGQIGDKS